MGIRSELCLLGGFEGNQGSGAKLGLKLGKLLPRNDVASTIVSS